MFFFDPTVLLLIPALIFAMYAQQKVSSTFRRFMQVYSTSGYTGAQVARRILDMNGLSDVAIEQVGGDLTDHYDPRSRVLRLSQAVYRSSSLAALGVAAHEAGHALQHANSYVPLGIRNNLFPVASIGSKAAFPLFFIGFIFAADSLMLIGIWFFLAALLFQVVTLPVEFNASNRAIRLLADGGFITTSEQPQAKAVLNAAALTYVASAAMAAAQLLRLLVLRGARR